MTGNNIWLSGLLSTSEVTAVFQQALTEQKPCSLSCLGDGEIQFIAHGLMPEFNNLPVGLSIYRSFIGEPAIRDALLRGISEADILGIPDKVFLGRWPPGESFLNRFRIRPPRTCDAYIGRALHFSGQLYNLLESRRVFLVGRDMAPLADYLAERSIQVSGMTTLNFFPDIPRVQDLMSKTVFDVAILSAGIPSLILAPWISRVLGRCAIDFGSAVYYVGKSRNCIGATRRDYPVFDPQARYGFRYIPHECR